MNVTIKAVIAIAIGVSFCLAAGCDLPFDSKHDPEDVGVVDEEVSRGSISGKVYTPVATEDNKIAGVPKAGALVTVGSCGLSGHTEIGRTTTRSDGSFSFQDLPTGGYCVYIGTGDPGSWYMGVSGYPVDVVANQNVQMDSLFTFDCGEYLICGVVRYANGSVYANDVLELYASTTIGDTREKIGARVTSADGSYAFSGRNCPEYFWFESPKGIVATNDPAFLEYAISYFKPYPYGYFSCDLKILQAEE